MTDNEKHPEVWRQRAEELRAMAVHFGNPRAKKDMLALADQWDRLADRAADKHNPDGDLAGC